MKRLAFSEYLNLFKWSANSSGNRFTRILECKKMQWIRDADSPLPVVGQQGLLVSFESCHYQSDLKAVI